MTGAVMELYPCPSITPVSIEDPAQNMLLSVNVDKKIQIIKNLCTHSTPVFDRVPLKMIPYKNIFSDSFFRCYMHFKEKFGSVCAITLLWSPDPEYTKRLLNNREESLIVCRSYLYVILSVLVASHHTASFDDVFKLALYFDPFVMFLFKYLDKRNFNIFWFADYEKRFNNLIPLYINDNAFFDENGILVSLSSDETTDGSVSADGSC